MRTVRARVAAVGMACPLGLRVRPALAAIHAGITPFFDREDIVGPGGPARVSMLDDPRLPATRLERAGFFARHAFTEALTSLAAADDLARRPLACILALPQLGVGPRIDPAALMQALAGLHVAPGIPAQLWLHGAIEEGRAGFFAALETALALLTLGREPLVLIAGVDSRVDDQTLRALADRNRLVGRSNFDGIIPGEGTGCVVLTTDPRQRPLAYVRANAVAREPSPFAQAGPPSNHKISGALGLTAVFRSLLGEVGGRVDEVFAGTTGEVYFGREFSHAYLRNAALMPEPLRHRTISAALGDVGAAAGALSAVHAIMRLGPDAPGNRGPANHSGLAYAASDDGLVGGCVMVAS